ncbi:MAG: tetratricopeptide repeat protein, partial [Phycisphaerales bacterium]|nr:tetratricopeptide repeat protein [Phycisphaerales bacterium]
MQTRLNIPETIKAGLHQQKLGNSAEAEKLFRAVLAQDPNESNALHLLGRLALDQDKPRVAIECIRKAIAARDTVPDYYRSLAAAYMADNEPDEAIRAYRRLLKLNPQDQPAAYALSSILTLSGRLDEAVELLEGAREADPDSDMLRGALSITLQHLNQTERASELLTPFEDRDSHHEAYAIAYAQLGRKKKVDPRRAIEVVNTTLAHPGLPERERIGLLFRLGDLYDAVGDVDQAFQTFTIANQVNPPAWDPESMTRYVDRIASLFKPGCMKDMPRSRNNSEVPVFIVGMPRSGTSLVEQILDCHPDVHGAGELRDIGRFMDALPGKLKTNKVYPLCHDLITTPFLDKFAKSHLSRLKKLSRTASRITDKMPTNFVALSVISQAFPNARVIHCVRNPFDTCLSCFFTPFSFGHVFTRDIVHLGRYYADYR